MNYQSVNKCRVCRSGNLTEVLSLGSQFVNDFVPVDEHLNGTRIPIEIDLCNTCYLVQARNTPPPNLLYKRQYWYRSGVTATMRSALRDVVDSARSLVELCPGDVVLDIGSNDGTLLRSYDDPSLVTIGVEPADNLQADGRIDIVELIHDFWPLGKGWPYKRARIVTAIGMFYDLDDPNPFVAGVAEALDYDGIFVAQLMCLRDMIELGDVGNFSHEHLEFYSLRSLFGLFESHGLEIFDIERNNINGSSYRFYVKHRGSPVAQVQDRKILEHFNSEALYTNSEAFTSFSQRIEDNRNACVDFISEVVSERKSVWVYGASTKGNVILQYYGLGRGLIEGAADRSPEKWGLCTIGTGIPIYSEEEARAINPNYFLALPYAFRDEFLRREKQWREGGGHFLFPLPTFEVV